MKIKGPINENLKKIASFFINEICKVPLELEKYGFVEEELLFQVMLILMIMMGILKK